VDDSEVVISHSHGIANHAHNGEGAMRDDEYRRLHAACLAMAKQSTEPDLQARWMAAADTWLKLAAEQHSRPGRALKTRAPLPNTFPFASLQRR
jgi:hypothetical protein